MDAIELLFFNNKIKIMTASNARSVEEISSADDHLSMSTQLSLYIT